MDGPFDQTNIASFIPMSHISFKQEQYFFLTATYGILLPLDEGMIRRCSIFLGCVTGKRLNVAEKLCCVTSRYRHKY